MRTAGAPATRPISGLNRPARDTRCLRFARQVALEDARLASGCWPDSTGWARRPTGFLRKVLSCLLHLSSFPRLSWRKRASVRHAEGSSAFGVDCFGPIARRDQPALGVADRRRSVWTVLATSSGRASGLAAGSRDRPCAGHAEASTGRRKRAGLAPGQDGLVAYSASSRASRPGPTGLVKCQSNPASPARCRSSSWTLPVGAISTVRSPHGRSRMRRKASYPLSRGIPMSSATPSGRNAAAAAAAAGWTAQGLALPGCRNRLRWPDDETKDAAAPSGP